MAQIQQRIADSEASALIQPSGVEDPGEHESATETILKEVASDVDGALQLALQRTNVDARRHNFGLINVKGEARISVGDYVAKGERPTGYGSNYGVVNAEGQTRVLYGNNYGGKSVLDD